MAAGVSGPGSRRSPAGAGHRRPDCRGNGVFASLHAQRASPLENGGGLLPGRACHDQRIALDSAPAEAVDPGAKDLATKQLARIEARNAAKKKATAPAKPKPALHPSRRQNERGLDR